MRDCGLPGGTSAFSARTAVTDAFWGPSVHWNRALGRYVMLVSHPCDVAWNGSQGRFVG